MDRLSARTRLLVVAPHPDDETLATGILIQRVLAAGGTVTVLLLTDGDNNPWPQRWLERRLLIGAAGRARWAARRRAELCAALRTLGVDPGQVIAMGWPDQGLTRQVACGAPACVDALVPVLARVRPNLLVMPALDDRHPDHGAAHVLMRLALERWTERPEVWLYRVHGGRRTARVVVPCVADATTRERKRAALGCHASQLVLSGRRMQRFAARSECFEPLEVRSYPQVLPWRPRWSQRPWLRLTAASAGGGDRWRWRAAPLQHDADGSYRLATRALPEGSGTLFVKLELALPSIWIFDRWGWRELHR